MRALVTGNSKYIIGLGVLCVLAYFSFGVLFRFVDVGLGAETAIAAFSALFVILATQFLRDHQDDSDRKKFIYQENVALYRDLAKLQVEVVRDQIVTLEEVQQLQTTHTMLCITGAPETIKASDNFIAVCVDAMRSSSGAITEAQKKALWQAARDYRNAARLGLYLPDDSLGNDFTHVDDNFNATEDAIIQQRAARSEVGLVDYFKGRNLSDNSKLAIKKIVSLIKNSGFECKFTKSQISIYPGDKKDVFGFVISYVKVEKNKNIVFDSPIIPDLLTAKKIISSDNYGTFKPAYREIKSGRDKGKFIISVNIDIEELQTNDLSLEVSEILNNFKTLKGL